MSGSSENECPICYIEYGKQEDGTFICKDGKCNSEEPTKCHHYCCVPCCQKIYNKLREDFKTPGWGKTGKFPEAYCSICREEWTRWILDNYDDESEEDEE
jgi:hypothetical protein